MAERIALRLVVNGTAHRVDAWPMARLLDVLRKDLRLTGTKEGCGEGECGACSVLLNGRVVASCLVPVVQAQDAKIVTVEGLSDGQTLSGLQAALAAGNGTQCGFCTPGVLIAAQDLLNRCPHPDPEAIREGLAGNLCRCTGYTKIVEAIDRAASGGPP